MIDLLLPISIVMGLLTWSLIAKWYAIPWLENRNIAEALTPFLLFNSLRYVGLAFLIPGVTSEPLDPRFASPAAWGDFIAAILALLALAAVRGRLRYAVAIVWLFNLFGALDLLNAVAQGLRFTVDGHLGATYFIPAMIVPPLLVTHILIAKILLRPVGATESLVDPLRIQTIGPTQLRD